MSKKKLGMTDAQFVKRAQKLYQDDGEVEVDDGAVVSRGSDMGAYVQAWVWVDDDVPSDRRKSKPKDTGEKCICPGCGNEHTTTEE